MMLDSAPITKKGSMMRLPYLTVLTSLLVLPLACAETQTPPPAAPPPAPMNAPPPATAEPTSAGTVDSDPTRGQLNIDPSIRQACGITDTEAYFSFDSANVQPGYRALLRKLSDCFMTGPLKGRQMRLVGHADPRGEDNYNLVLGGQRADNVKKTLVAEGMAADKVQTSSRGEEDATGTDEAGWAKDRRVDVQMGD